MVIFPCSILCVQMGILNDTNGAGPSIIAQMFYNQKPTSPRTGIPNGDADGAGWADCHGFYGKKFAKTSALSVIRVLILVIFGIAAPRKWAIRHC